jgi:hypothetical protein
MQRMSGFANRDLSRQIPRSLTGFPAAAGKRASLIAAVLPSAAFKIDFTMKRIFPSEGKKRFGGQLRHYHRTGGQNRRTWDEWVDGDASRPVSKGKWLKILGILLAFLALGGIVAGLFIELR